MVFKDEDETIDHRDQSPISVAGYFQDSLLVSLDEDRRFRVYINHPIQHHPDHSPIYFIFHHGAGYSALSAACLAQQVSLQSQARFGLLSFDCRAHGQSVIQPDHPNPPDLSLSTLSNDLIDLLATLYPPNHPSPSFVLIGHSMGAAVVTESCASIHHRIGQVLGLVILDVVEGSALKSLIGMIPLLRSRPSSFSSPEECIKYHLDSHTIRNPTSARISVPNLIRKVPSNSSSDQQNDSDGSQRFEWITDLANTQPYWEGWYRGLSKKFLSQPTARLLVLAGTDRLDKELMIGQMQGKYQLSIVPNVGHCIHEDNPIKLAEILIQFTDRNDRTSSDEILARLGKKPLQRIVQPS